LSLSLRDLLAFFVEFERALHQTAAPGVMNAPVRQTEKLLKLFQLYSGCHFFVDRDDLSDGLAINPQDEMSEPDSPQTMWSYVLNFGDRAEIIINDMERPGSNKKLVNFCYSRFLTIKEAYHIILKDEFARRGEVHPDTATPETLVTLAEELTFLPFSIIDFDSDEYPDAIKIENAAELLAFITLYPLDNVAKDIEQFHKLGEAFHYKSPTVIVTSTLDFAERYKVPRRYVDLLFRLDRFSELYSLYRQLRDGF
jgi:hypothetical protein